MFALGLILFYSLSPSAGAAEINVPETPLLIYGPYDEHSDALSQ